MNSISSKSATVDLSSNADQHSYDASRSHSSSRPIKSVSLHAPVSSFQSAKVDEHIPSTATFTWNQLRDLARRHFTVTNVTRMLATAKTASASSSTSTGSSRSSSTIAPLLYRANCSQSNTSIRPFSFVPKSLSSAEIFACFRTNVFTVKSPSAVNTHRLSFRSQSNRSSSIIPVQRSQTEVNISAETLPIRDADLQVYCALCLDHCSLTAIHQLLCCGCTYCVPCLSRYVQICVQEHTDLLRLSCPSHDCPAAPHNLLSEHEIRALCSDDLFALYERLRRQQQVAADPQLLWCPRPDCEGVCRLPENWLVCSNGDVRLESSIDASKSSSVSNSLFHVSCKSQLERIPVECAVCRFTFCAHCRRAFHHQLPCQSHSEDESLALLLKRTTNDSDALQIKRCPQCAVYIQRDEGCAQMMCRKCKHVFCWFCMQSLEVSALTKVKIESCRSHTCFHTIDRLSSSPSSSFFFRKGRSAVASL